MPKKCSFLVKTFPKTPKNVFFWPVFFSPLISLHSIKKAFCAHVMCYIKVFSVMIRTVIKNSEKVIWAVDGKSLSLVDRVIEF